MCAVDLNETADAICVYSAPDLLRQQLISRSMTRTMQQPCMVFNLYCTTPPHPALATGGSLTQMQDTGTCLPCCEWLRPILQPGHGQTTQAKPSPLRSATATQPAAPWLRGGLNYLSTKSVWSRCTLQVKIRGRISMRSLSSDTKW